MIGRLEMEEFDKFQERMNKYGLEVDRSTIRRDYVKIEPGVYIAWMITKSHPVKGNKKLIDQLRKDRFHVAVFRKTDQRTLADYMVFQVSVSVRIETEENAP